MLHIMCVFAWIDSIYRKCWQVHKYIYTSTFKQVLHKYELTVITVFTSIC